MWVSRGCWLAAQWDQALCLVAYLWSLALAVRSCGGFVSCELELSSVLVVWTRLVCLCKLPGCVSTAVLHIWGVHSKHRPAHPLSCSIASHVHFRRVAPLSSDAGRHRCRPPQVQAATTTDMYCLSVSQVSRGMQQLLVWKVFIWTCLQA
jgi:hypothetical protein